MTWVEQASRHHEEHAWHHCKTETVPKKDHLPVEPSAEIMRGRKRREPLVGSGLDNSTRRR